MTVAREVLFYGVWPGSRAGHYLRDRAGQLLGYGSENPHLAVLYQVRSAGPYPWDTRADWRSPQEQGRFYVLQLKTVTLITCWDRSEDTRGGCCTAFLFPGPPLNREAALERARQTFPQVFARMAAAGIEIGWAEEGA